MANELIVVQVAGFSGCGKTTLAQRIVAQARAEGHLVGYVKHHHGPLERSGSDTDLAGRAGAALRWLAGSDGSCSLGRPTELADLISSAKAGGCSLVVVEGFKSSPGAKCWLRRGPNDFPPPYVPGVELDILGADALSLDGAQLLQRLPQREV